MLKSDIEARLRAAEADLVASRAADDDERGQAERAEAERAVRRLRRQLRRKENRCSSPMT